MQKPKVFQKVKQQRREEDGKVRIGVAKKSKSKNKALVKVKRRLVWTFPNGILALLFGPPAWVLIHIFSLIHQGTIAEQKEFIRLILITLPCQTCYQNLKGYLTRKEVFKKYGAMAKDKTNYFAYLWVKIHNHANRSTGKRPAKVRTVLEKLKATDKSITQAIYALIQYLMYCATHELSPGTFSESEKLGQTSYLSETQNRVFEFRQLLPLVQFSAFISETRFFNDIEHPAVKQFLLLFTKSGLSDTFPYYPTTNSDKVISRLFWIQSQFQKWEEQNFYSLSLSSFSSLSPPPSPSSLSLSGGVKTGSPKERKEIAQQQRKLVPNSSAVKAQLPLMSYPLAVQQHLLSLSML